MATAFPPPSRGLPSWRLPRAATLAQRLTVHIALSLVSFALVQLWIVSSAVSLGASRALPFISLAALILVALPVARVFERRWSNFAAKSLPSRGLLARYRADVRTLWACALLVPPLWVGTLLFVGKAAAAVTG